MVRQAAQGELFHNDDTSVRILKMERCGPHSGTLRIPPLKRSVTADRFSTRGDAGLTT
ncbi:hypothetical protein SBA6_410040 [Candidatus Sulfopaludibacter sp. SbA6]|nr:hypothetical protein SBA6_410040 [Candidatus Sulfopaludibacter sp. SbA6]